MMMMMKMKRFAIRSPVWPRWVVARRRRTGGPPPPVDFGDHATAFRSKTTWEIARALAILKLCSVNALVDNSLEVMRRVEGVFGGKFLRLLLRPTLYGQFVGGENPEEVRCCMRKLALAGTRAMLAATMEEDVGEGGVECVYEGNCERILQSIAISARDTPSPMVQLKLSGLLPADLLVILGDRYSSSADKLQLIRSVSRGLTGDEIDVSPFADVLDDRKKETLNRAVRRLKTICLAASDRGVKVLVDAEYTHLNPGLSLLTMAATAAFNQEWPVVWNTYQCYLKDAERKVTDETGLVLGRLSACFGAKVVRGAYMLQERRRARAHRTPDPVCDTYEDTCVNYDRVVSGLMEQTSALGPRCQFIVATHNERSVQLAVRRMFELNIDKERGGVSFGQLYGMCDQVTHPLALAGFSVYKSIPFGRVEEVLPYLARRALENRSVLEGARREGALLDRELKRRLLGRC